MSLVLASGSPRRKALLEGVGVQLAAVVPPSIPETRHNGETPTAYVCRLAREKAEAVTVPEHWILAADTIVFDADRLFEKPRDTADAVEILSYLSGKWHHVTTAWHLRFCPHEQTDDATHSQRGHCTTQVKFRTLTDHEINAYIRSGEGTDKAGSYGIQGIGAALVEQVQGDFSNVVGLPMPDVLHALASVGVIPQREPTR